METIDMSGSPLSGGSSRSQNNPHEFDLRSCATRSETGIDASPLQVRAGRSGRLTKGMIERGLSSLGRTGDGTKVAYKNLTISGLGLSEVGMVATFPHLQSLDLSSNCLTDLSVLGSLCNLVYLNASYNKLSSVLHFTPCRSLKEANYSHNEIEEMRDLSTFSSLTKLNLDCNQIAEISGVHGLQCLTYLSLAENRIESITNLDSLPLSYLNLSGNMITQIGDLSSLTSLQVLDLSGNQISSLEALGVLTSLYQLDLRENQVVSLEELNHLYVLHKLRILNLLHNPVESLAEYRPTVLYHLSLITELDNKTIDVEEKVGALNRFNPPQEVIAALDHMNNMTKSIRKAAVLNYSTLTSLDEPYPLLVLCGPAGSGKAQLARQLVEEFPRFFGLGISHTTRPQTSVESHGREYYFIDTDTFQRAVESGDFLETSSYGGHWYGLAMASLERVAQQGLACITHMNLEGVLSLKKSHFEPRYILTVPLNPQIHEQRLKSKTEYTSEQIAAILREVHLYKTFHQERPGFFDSSLNTDSSREAYTHLRALVMAYGGITPDGSLVFSDSSHLTTTIDTSQSTLPEVQPPPPDQSILAPGVSATSLVVDEIGGHGHTPQAVGVRVWSRSSSSVRSSSRPVSGPTGSEGITNRRQLQAIAAVAGKPSIPASDVKPGTSGFKPRTASGLVQPGDQVRTPAASKQSVESREEEDGEEEDEDGEEESSEEETSENSSHSSESFSELSSSRAVSPPREDA